MNAHELPKGLEERRLEPLYRGALTEFVSLRNELAAELKREGAGAAGAWVRALRKPAMTAWAVNQLAYDHGQELAKLRVAGDGLRAAQASGDVTALERAAKARRQVIESLMTAAEQALTAHGHQASRSALQKIHRTLEAIAALGSERQPEPPPGRLETDLEPPGFDVLLGAPIAKPRKSATRNSPSGKSRRAPGAAARGAEKAADARRHARLEKLVRAATAALEEYDSSRETRRSVATELERATRREHDAERSLERVKERLERAKSDLAAAVADRRTAERELAKAERDLQRRRSALQRAQDRLKAMQS